MTPTDRLRAATSYGWRTAVRWLLTSIAGGLGGLLCAMFVGAILLPPRHNPAGFPLLTSGDFLIWLGGCVLGSYLLSRATGQLTSQYAPGAWYARLVGRPASWRSVSRSSPP